MDISIDEALLRGIEAYKNGDLKTASKIYYKIIDMDPRHPETNYRVGQLLFNTGDVAASLEYFKSAVEVNLRNPNYWVSYLNALICSGDLSKAKALLEMAKTTEIPHVYIKSLETKLNVIIKQHRYNIQCKAELEKIRDILKKSNFSEAIHESIKLLQLFPNSDEVLNILSIGYLGSGQAEMAEVYCKNAITLNPYSFKTQSNLAVIYHRRGKLKEARVCCDNAIALQPDLSGTYATKGHILMDLGFVDEAKSEYAKSLRINPNYFNSFWNLTGTSKSIVEAKNWLTKCLEINPKHEKAMLLLSAIRYYDGEEESFRDLLKSSFKEHPHVRSFSWVFNLAELPPLFFNRWDLFNYVIGLSKRSRPFYEFGVWRGVSFEFFIDHYGSGYGFDTFDGIPEDWHGEVAGTYSSDGNIPKITGGEFIVGKFEDTLHVFFSEHRPKASLINFDADLYSSTICALNEAKPVIDEHTILIFDEFLMNDYWEQDEHKALEEFCLNFGLTYEVLAVSFTTKQLAIKIKGLEEHH